MLVKEDIQQGARFRLSNGTIFVIDTVTNMHPGLLVAASSQGANYNDNIDDIVSFLNEEGAVKVMRNGGSISGDILHTAMLTKKNGPERIFVAMYFSSDDNEHTLEWHGTHTTGAAHYFKKYERAKEEFDSMVKSLKDTYSMDDVEMDVTEEQIQKYSHGGDIRKMKSGGPTDYPYKKVQFIGDNRAFWYVISQDKGIYELVLDEKIAEYEATKGTPDVEYYIEYDEAKNFEPYVPPVKMEKGGAVAGKKARFVYKVITDGKPQMVTDNTLFGDEELGPEKPKRKKSLPEVETTGTTTALLPEVELVRKGIKQLEGKDALFIKTPDDAGRIFHQIFPKDVMGVQEHFYALFLNRRNMVMGYYFLSKGGTAATIVDVKLLAAAAFKLLAGGIIIAHNHPSGNLTPSRADVELAKSLKKSLKLLDIDLLDSLIIIPSDTNEYYSMGQNDEF